MKGKERMRRMTGREERERKDVYRKEREKNILSIKLVASVSLFALLLCSKSALLTCLVGGVIHLVSLGSLSVK